MGNNRVFDYTEIARIYGEMNTITGDSSDPTSIAGLLHKINEEYTEVVNGPAGEDELALKGDAASDLKNSWDNTVSDHFTKFVENFDAWSSAVAASAGDYTKFEQAVQGIRSANTLGWNSGGATDSSSATGFYSTAMSEQELADLTAQAQFYQLTGATYVDTGMVSYAKKKKVWNTVQTVLAVGGVVSSGFTMFGAGANGLLTLSPSITTPLAVQVGQTAALNWSLTRSMAGLSPLATFAYDAVKTAALVTPVIGTSSGVVGDIVSFLNPNYDASKYMTGNLDMPVAVGESKNINGVDYTFVGSSNSGVNIYYDSNNNMVYDDGHGNLLPVTDPSGNQATYVEGGNTVINAGNEVIGPQTTLTSNFAPREYDEDYKNHYENLGTISQQSSAWLNSNGGATTSNTNTSGTNTSGTNNYGASTSGTMTYNSGNQLHANGGSCRPSQSMHVPNYLGGNSNSNENSSSDDNNIVLYTRTAPIPAGNENSLNAETSSNDENLQGVVI